MNKDALWKLYCARNPSFAKEGGEITFTQAGLQKFFDLTYDQGYKSGKEFGECLGMIKMGGEMLIARAKGESIASPAPQAKPERPPGARP